MMERVGLSKFSLIILSALKHRLNIFYEHVYIQ